MFTLLISILVATAGVTACKLSGVGSAGTVWAGIGAFLLTHILVGLLVRRRLKKIQDELQTMLQVGQGKLQRKIQQFQSRPGGNLKQMQRQLEADQAALITEALAFTNRFEPFRKWSLFMGRQIATMRMQFHYQLKQFDDVDRILATGGLLTGPMMMEPVTVAMKMARQYEHKEFDRLEKTFKRHLIWFRGNRGKLLYGLMSWVYLKQGETEKARHLLIKAKDATGDETLARNLEVLSNNKEKQFSNAGLGEEWYGLYLENPPAPKQQRIRGNARGGRPF